MLLALSDHAASRVPHACRGRYGPVDRPRRRLAGSHACGGRGRVPHLQSERGSGPNGYPPGTAFAGVWSAQCAHRNATLA